MNAKHACRLCHCHIRIVFWNSALGCADASWQWEPLGTQSTQPLSLIEWTKWVALCCGAEGKGNQTYVVSVEQLTCGEQSEAYLDVKLGWHKNHWSSNQPQ